MNRFFVEEMNIPVNSMVEITGEDAHHMKNVLRLKIGEQIIVCDGKSVDYVCNVHEYTESGVMCQVVDSCNSLAEFDTEIILFQGYPKSDKMELIIQKTVELGVSKIVPVMTKRTIVKLDDKKSGKKTERYNSIALSAAKQCGRGIVPEVTKPVSYKEAIKMANELDMTIVPYEEAEGIEYSRKVISEIKGKKSLGIFIGPEGGFDPLEIEEIKGIGAKVITLGHRILRTETAGLAVMSIIMYELEK